MRGWTLDELASLSAAGRGLLEGARAIYYDETIAVQQRAIAQALAPPERS